MSGYLAGEQAIVGGGAKNASARQRQAHSLGKGPEPFARTAERQMAPIGPATPMQWGEPALEWSRRPSGLGE